MYSEIGTLFLIVFIIVTAVAIIFIILYFRSTLYLVSPSQCGASFGTYSVTPARSGVMLNTCGDGTQPCKFVAYTLEEAINICNEQESKCDAFAYSEVNRALSFIDITQELIPTVLGGVYRRYVNPVILR